MFRQDARLEGACRAGGGDTLEVGAGLGSTRQPLIISNKNTKYSLDIQIVQAEMQRQGLDIFKLVVTSLSPHKA